jgi:hypothetical protein
MLLTLGALGLGLSLSLPSLLAAKPKREKTAATAPPPKPSLIPSLPTSTWHTWSDPAGNRIEAELLSVDGERIVVRTREGQSYRLNLTRLVPQDREFTQKATALLPASSVPVEEAAARLDAAVEKRLQTASLTLNPPAPDTVFLRRLYLDVAGRIPTAAEVTKFMENPDPGKRSKLIDELLLSEGYRSHLFNWMADLLRVTDDYGKGVKSFVYQEWLKDEIAANRHWDTLVYELMTAEGRISSTGAVGYLLRDRGMPLDNLSNTLSIFLGANVACAQCHDHPMAQWTQRNFYEMAAFFGATEQGFKRGVGVPKNALDKKLTIALTAPYLARVETLPKPTLTFPSDYKYDDAKPGDLVPPKLLTWSASDAHNPAYLGASTDQAPQLRERFAVWLTHPENPRFALTIANRLWKRFLGLGVQEPLTDLDDLSRASNPELLRLLGEEMKRVHFDLREFQRILLHTRTYQAQASPSPKPEQETVLCQGPLLRRMSAEQAWDSVLTLVLGSELDQFKLRRAEEVRRLDIPEEHLTAAILKAKAEELGLEEDSGKKALRKIRSNPKDAYAGVQPPQIDGLTLARASELPQPSKESHFLRNFGQSDRQISESNSSEGSVPQILMLMNGEIQKVIGGNQSLVLRETLRQPDPDSQIQHLYRSFLARPPSEAERQAARSKMDSGLKPKDLTWVFLNTREFLFIQ